MPHRTSSHKLRLKSLATSLLQKDRVVIYGIILLAIFTRFWRLSELLHWTLDEEYWAYVVRNIATGYHLPLIGGPAAGTGLYLGPLYVWLVGLYGAIFGTHPVTLGIFASTLGVLTTVAIVKLFPKLLGRHGAYLTAFLYTFSVFAQLYDRKFWNATPLPLLSVLTLYLTHQVINQKQAKPWLLPALALVISLAFHAHLSGAVLTLFVFTAFTIHHIPKKYFTQLAIFFALLQTPLVIFDLRHNFTNLHALGKFVTAQSSQHINLISRGVEAVQITLTTYARALYTPVTDIARELTLCTDYANSRVLPPIIYTLVACLILLFALKQLRAKNLFSLLLLVNLVGFFLFRLLAADSTLYPGQLSEYYLLSSLVPFFIFGAQLIIRLHKHAPLASFSVLIFFAAINLNRTSELIHTHGFITKDQTVTSAISKLDGHAFGLRVTGDPCQIYGYRYLFTVYGREPASSYLDANFAWLYQTAPSPIPPQKSLVIDADSATIELSDVSTSP